MSNVFSNDQLFNSLKGQPREFVISFTPGGKRYQLSFVTGVIKDPVFGWFKGALYCYFVPEPVDWDESKHGKFQRIDVFRFRFSRQKVYVWGNYLVSKPAGRNHRKN